MSPEFIREHISWLKVMLRTIAQLSPRPQMSERSSSTMYRVVELPDHHCGDDLITACHTTCKHISDSSAIVSVMPTFPPGDLLADRDFVAPRHRPSPSGPRRHRLNIDHRWHSVRNTVHTGRIGHNAGTPVNYPFGAFCSTTGFIRSIIPGRRPR